MTIRVLVVEDQPKILKAQIKLLETFEEIQIVGEALSKKNISRAESQLYGQAYFVLGQVAEGENKLPEAMENYCRTVAIFYQERSVVAEAQKRIDDLRQKGVTTP